ncbi:MAG TPA: OmpA family protein [Cytophagaceae bacterium]
MLKNIFTAFAIIFSSWQLAFSQGNFAPKNLGESVNSEHAELNPLVSPDGNLLYFIRVDHPENNYHGEKDETQDVWYSELQKDRTWGPAKPASQINHGHYNAVLAISGDGNTYIINGVYDKKFRWVKRGISSVQKMGETWTTPQQIKIKSYTRKNRGVASNAALSKDGSVLFLSYTKTYNGKKNDLFVSKMFEGEWQKPVKLSDVINTKKYSEEAPYFNTSNGTLYFSSNRKPGKENKIDYDIYSSKMLDDTYLSWSEPKPLSDTINSKSWDSYFKMNDKGSWAYWASTRDGKALPDIYRIKVFEENPFVLVSGIVKNKTKGEALAAKFPFVISSNGVVIDSAKINPDSATYSVKLPLGKAYEIKANVKHFEGDVEKIDVTNEREYLEISKNLNVTPLPFLLVQGKVVVKPNNGSIPLSANPKVYVNGLPIDTVIIDNEGNYALKLRFGKKYDVQVKANRYVPEIQKFDFSDKSEFEEINQDLYVQKALEPAPNLAIITGKIYDRKTGKPIAPDKKYQVNVNDVPANLVNINVATSEYKVQVPLGSSYTINAYAPDYYPVYEIIDLTKDKGTVKVMRDLTISPIEVGVSIKLKNIFFETGKATLKANSYPEMDRVVKFLTENPSIKIEIEGHTDNVGNAKSNLLLSENRAKSVVGYLWSKGIGAGRVIPRGYGMTKPVASNKTKNGKALNRRVEFTILEK